MCIAGFGLYRVYGLRGYSGSLDIVIVLFGHFEVKRQSLNVFRMKMLGAKVVAVKGGSMTLKDAINEAIRDWVTNVNTTHYIIGSAIGPHPFPTIVRDLQTIIGREARQQVGNNSMSRWFIRNVDAGSSWKIAKCDCGLCWWWE